MGKRKLRAKLAEATADRAKAGVTLNDYAKQLNIAMDRLKAAAHKLATAQGMTRSARQRNKELGSAFIKQLSQKNELIERLVRSRDALIADVTGYTDWIRRIVELIEPDLERLGGSRDVVALIVEAREVIDGKGFRPPPLAKASDGQAQNKP